MVADNILKFVAPPRLIAAFKHPLAETMLMFLHTALTPLINLNLLLQRSDSLIHILYNTLFTCVKQLLSRFASPELVRKFANGDVTIVQIKGEIIKDENTAKESLMSFTNPSASFIAQLLFTLSATFLYRMSFCSAHSSWIFMIKNVPSKVFFPLLRSWKRASIFLIKIRVT